jgi:DNA-binding beta-propeller fold protein YncE
VFNINANGTIAPIAGQSNFQAGNTPHNLTVSGQFLYTANINSNNISAFSINSSTGALTPLTGSPFATGVGPNEVVVHPNGQVLFTADQNDSAVARFNINADGTLTRNGNAATFPAASGTNGIAMTNF